MDGGRRSGRRDKLVAMARHFLRVGLVAACLGCLALAWIGVQLNFPWLVAENLRLEPWKIPLVWLSEATGLVAFLAFTASIALWGTTRRWWPRKLTLSLFILGIGLDATMTVWSMVDEYAGHSRSVRVQAQVVEGKARVQPAGDTLYTFTCTFQEQQGQLHTAWFPHFDKVVPQNVRQAIQAGQLPVAIDLTYDPKWPGRSWLADWEYSDDGRLFFYSLMAVFCSSLLAPALTGWNEQHRLIPAGGTAPFLVMIPFFCGAGFFQGW